MSGCHATECSTQTKAKRRACPLNGRKGTAVPLTTIQFHLAEPWRRALTEQSYYFCDDPACDVVYFADDDSMIFQSELRTWVGHKDPSEDALICYCFGVTRREALSNPEVKEFVKEQTRQSRCACTSFNPSARCCLKDFP